MNLFSLSIFRASSPAPERNFTLIELLVVIAIIAILAGMLLPALGKTKESAHSAQCLSQNKQHALAFQNYFHDFQEFIPQYQGHVSNPDYDCPAAFSEGFKKYKRIHGAYSSGTIAVNSQGSCYVSLAALYLNYDMSIFYCPGDKRPDLSPGSYSSYNSYGVNYGSGMFQPTKLLRITRFLYPSQILLNGESDVGLGVWSAPAGGAWHSWNKTSAFDGHGARRNFACADGHAVTYNSTEILAKPSLLQVTARR